MLQESGNWMARVGPAVVLALLACSVTHAQDVKYNYRQGTDFSKYHTYKWVDAVDGVPAIGGHFDQILDSEIKQQSIDSQLAAKGLTKVDSPRRGGWGPWGMESLSGTATSSTINIGTLVLGIYIAAAKLLVWMGTANKTVNPGKNQEKNRKNLDKATQKLLKDFPPNANRH